ncbi:Aerobic glycerol-3-phosphate dehydrogenase [Anatilimnocola aggregata]|uniref:Glycerol-3-phosphate dehydrogenase n=1 Tax=Anatilimnocola aggregata TaxID=2528021 RepID=A0A517Y5I2_9BACT|nr:glycerol-3-phosphate dehydrogenase/oxidase [Anatilimnocola aggregata]QDU25450.1 Aerobic glycerol-3-phosphate dehydrogenase [Anatilimnocola aggregata]
MNRDNMRAQAFTAHATWDLVIIGGGATGVGIAIDAAARGYRTLLAEQHDFGKGTSSRSTKLVHGGVRYLAQGNISLVTEALRERGLLRQNAPHLVHDLAFVVPSYRWWEAPYYGLGLKAYSLLAGKLRFGPTQFLSQAEVVRRIPTIKRAGLRGGVVYSDGQFDDARLLINMVTTAAEQGATLLNYARVTAIHKSAAGHASGVEIEDRETGESIAVTARAVINATGPFCDDLRKLADPSSTNMISPSQGIHLVFARSFLPGNHAIMVPRTADGRVMFAIPWHGHTLVGTTDVPIQDTPLEPLATETEIDFILETAGRYFERQPTRANVLSMFAGIRPLVKAANQKSTAALSRDHTIHVDSSGLITITGGKWTTYRNMAEDCVNQAAERAELAKRPCTTRELPIHGHQANAEQFGNLAMYGADAPAIRALADSHSVLAELLHPDLPSIAAEVVWAARNEMARTVEDVLARRTRALFLNARAAMSMAPRVAELLASELNRDANWQRDEVEAFEMLAAGYLP